MGVTDRKADARGCALLEDGTKKSRDAEILVVADFAAFASSRIFGDAVAVVGIATFVGPGAFCVGLTGADADSAVGGVSEAVESGFAVGIAGFAFACALVGTADAAETLARLTVGAIAVVLASTGFFAVAEVVAFFSRDTRACGCTQSEANARSCALRSGNASQTCFTKDVGVARFAEFASIVGVAASQTGGTNFSAATFAVALASASSGAVGEGFAGFAVRTGACGGAVFKADAAVCALLEDHAVQSCGAEVLGIADLAKLAISTCGTARALVVLASFTVVAVGVALAGANGGPCGEGGAFFARSAKAACIGAIGETDARGALWRCENTGESACTIGGNRTGCACFASARVGSAGVDRANAVDVVLFEGAARA